MDNGAAAQPAEIAEVTERLSKYDNAETTSELYDFGKLLLEEGVDRAHWLDAKAGVMAGFSGGLVALLLSMFPMWKAWRWFRARFASWSSLELSVCSSRVSPHS
jgi:hypothetical protein